MNLKRCATATALILLFLAPALAQSPVRADASRMESRIKALSQFGLNANGGSDRVAFSEHDKQGREYIIGLMKNAGLEVRIDAAANIIGRRKGRFDDRKPIVFGSHIDTVPNGGAYDGCVGVIGALEVIELLNENKITTDGPLEVIVFTDEEGGLTGSRAFVGDLGTEAQTVVNNSGKTIAEGIRFLGGDPGRIAEAARKEGDIKAYLELHIEQGGVLESKGLNIGVVEGIVGIEWWEVTIEGFANHAGTTPMKGRRDAVLAGARFALMVNEVVNSLGGAQVGTVGKFVAEPGAPNVIPGKVTLSLELRDLSAERIFRMYNMIEKRAIVIADETGTEINFRHLDVSAIPALTDEGFKSAIEASAKELGLTYQRMPSGAGHDAQDVAKIGPIGMIFVPSRGGISHAPAEFTSAEDMANGASVLLRTILAIDGKE
ncbi:MAG: M20 family metallo-hydrolase [Acidobacteriota bacterium]|nr:MAG: M20 family metallo-hydrolase [Acidobacteriota bacterium]